MVLSNRPPTPWLHHDVQLIGGGDLWSFSTLLLEDRKLRKERKERKRFNGYRMVCEVGCGLVLSLTLTGCYATGRFAALTGSTTGGFALRSPH